VFVDKVNKEIQDINLEFASHHQGQALLLNNASEHAAFFDELQFNCKVKLKNDMYIKPFVHELEGIIHRLKILKKYMINVD
jgi:hypothetical protein